MSRRERLFYARCYIAEARNWRLADNAGEAAYCLALAGEYRRAAMK
jgi:hypothetical protein